MVQNVELRKLDLVDLLLQTSKPQDKKALKQNLVTGLDHDQKLLNKF